MERTPGLSHATGSHDDVVADAASQKVTASTKAPEAQPGATAGGDASTMTRGVDRDDTTPPPLVAFRTKVSDPGTQVSLLAPRYRAAHRSAAGKDAEAQGWAHGVEVATGTPPTRAWAT
jgi:hypothetical protein